MRDDDASMQGFQLVGLRTILQLAFRLASDEAGKAVDQFDAEEFRWRPGEAGGQRLVQLQHRLRAERRPRDCRSL